MTHINIDLSSYWISIILFLWKEFRLKKLKNMQICKFYFSKYVREQTNQWHRRHNGVKIILKSHNNFLCFWKFTKHFFIFCDFCLQKTLNRKLTQIELLVRPKKKPLATFIVRGNQIWVEACFCLIASIRLVDGKKPQDAKIVKSEEAPPYNGKTRLQVIFNQIDTFFF